MTRAFTTCSLMACDRKPLAQKRVSSLPSVEQPHFLWVCPTARAAGSNS